MGFMGGETGYCSEKCDVDGTEEIRIMFEEVMRLKDGVPEAITFPEMTEHEVRLLWGVGFVVAAHAFRPFIAPK
jgi:hypothetical protein